MAKKLDLTGIHFGELIALAPAEKRNDKYTRWICQCSCFHKNYKANLGHFHKQFDCHDLEYGLYRCFTHDFNIKYSIPYGKEDWVRFKKDALKYKLLDV